MRSENEGSSAVEDETTSVERGRWRNNLSVSVNVPPGGPIGYDESSESSLRYYSSFDVSGKTAHSIARVP